MRRGSMMGEWGQPTRVRAEGPMNEGASPESAPCNCRDAGVHEEIAFLYKRLVLEPQGLIDSRGLLNSDGRRILAKIGKLVALIGGPKNSVWEAIKEPGLESICKSLGAVLERTATMGCLEKCKPRAAQTVRETVIACANSANPAALIASDHLSWGHAL